MRRCQQAECGRPLDGYRRDARYCSGACRAAASPARVLSTTPTTKAHRGAQRRTPAIRWRLPEDADNFIAAVLRELPGSYEVPRNARRPDVARSRAVHRPLRSRRWIEGNGRKVGDPQLGDSRARRAR
jgi:hypothetical protein